MLKPTQTARVHSTIVNVVSMAPGISQDMLFNTFKGAMAREQFDVVITMLVMSGSLTRHDNGTLSNY